jgi:signal transduction histidine kinase
MSPSLTQSRALLAHQQARSQQQHSRLARKIHDEISQKMTLLSLQLSLAASDETPPEDWAVKCKDWAAVVLDLGQAIRSITSELQPKIVDDTALTGALRWFAQTSANAISCVLTTPKENISVPAFVGAELFEICRELVMEVFVPGGIARTEIALERTASTVQLRLRADDNAKITDQTLEAMDLPDRLSCLDGNAEISRSPETGLVITLSVPAAPVAG